MVPNSSGPDIFVARDAESIDMDFESCGGFTNFRIVVGIRKPFEIETKISHSKTFLFQRPLDPLQALDNRDSFLFHLAVLPTRFRLL